MLDIVKNVWNAVSVSAKIIGGVLKIVSSLLGGIVGIAMANHQIKQLKDAERRNRRSRYLCCREALFR